jgi:Putative auto-transporter adhesin, head GIN domain
MNNFRPWEVAVLLAATAATPSIGAERNFSVQPFDAIVSSGAADVIVTTGTDFAVRAEADPATLELLTVHADGNRLTIGMRNGVRWTRRMTATIYVSVPSLTSAQNAGSGNISVDRVTGTSFYAETSGSGNVIIGGIQTGSATLVSSGSGNVQARGGVEFLHARATGSGNVGASDLRAISANLEASGSGNVDVWASGNVVISVLGSGNVTTHGGARCQVVQEGSGEALCL